MREGIREGRKEGRKEGRRGENSQRSNSALVTKMKVSLNESERLAQAYTVPCHGQGGEAIDQGQLVTPQIVVEGATFALGGAAGDTNGRGCKSGGGGVCL